MPAYIVVIPERLPTDGDLRYGNEIGATLAPYGGRYVRHHYHRREVLEGDFALPLGSMAMLEFPSYEQARAWYDSDAYASLKAHRQRRGRFTLILLDTMPADEPPERVAQDQRSRMVEKPA